MGRYIIELEAEEQEVLDAHDKGPDFGGTIEELIEKDVYSKIGYSFGVSAREHERRIQLKMFEWIAVMGSMLVLYIVATVILYNYSVETGDLKKDKDALIEKIEKQNVLIDTMKQELYDQRWKQDRNGYPDIDLENVY